MLGVENIKDRIMDGVSLKNTLYHGKPSKREKIFYYRSREIYAVRYKKYKAHYITQGVFTIILLGVQKNNFKRAITV